jgi:putative aldouronate transport system substrate-binding protein
MKKLISLFLVLGLMGCMASAATADAETTVRIQIMNEFNGLDKVLEEYYRRVAGDPVLEKIKLDFSYVGGGDYRDKINMLMTTKDEPFDLVFIGAWHGLENYAKAGLLTDLTGYFCNPDYPGLERAFPLDLVEAAMTYQQDEDGNWSKALYKIPLAQALEDIRGLVYREDMRVKYGIPEITDDDILMQYLETVMANEPDFSFGWSMYMGFAYQFSPHFSAMHDHVYDVDFLGNWEAPFYIAINETGDTVLNAVIMGDDQAEFDKMPEGYQYDFISETRLNQLKWVPFLSPYRGTAEDEIGFSPIIYSPLTVVVTQMNELQDEVDLLSVWPDASLRFYPAEQDQREMKDGAIVSPMVSNNFICVPSWSENVDATMKFLDWMFASQENHDLFELGIEGIHWEAVGDKGFRQIFSDSSDKYTMPGYAFTWNPSYVRYNETVMGNAELKQYYDYQNSAAAYTPSLLSGFAFDTSAVSTEVATITAYAGELQLRFALGGEQTQEMIEDFHVKAMDAGLEMIRNELIRQVQAFLDMKNAVK